MKTTIKKSLSAESRIQEEYALNLVSSIIQNEIAIGYYLKVSEVKESYIDVTIISPQIISPIDVRVPIKSTELSYNSNTWNRIKSEIKRNLK